MPVMKPIKCHTPSCKRSVWYASGPDNPKVLGRDLVNLVERDAEGLEPWRQLDRTRELSGRFKPRMTAVKDKEGNPVLDGEGNPVMRDATVYYIHFVISPDPRDNVALDVLRQVAVEWVGREFPGFQAVVGYHADTGIPHAHAIVNGCDMAGERRAIDVVRPKGWCRSAWEDLQGIARAHGLRGFITSGEDEFEASVEAQAAAGRAAAQAPPEGEWRAPDGRCKAVRGLAARGEYSWVEDVRSRCECAARLVGDAQGYRRALAAMGVEVAEAARGGWKYTLEGEPRHQVTAARLGARWTEAGVARRLALDASRGVPKPRGARLAGVEATLRRLVAMGATGARAAVVAGAPADAAGRQELVDRVADALAWAARMDVASMADMRAAASEMPGEEADAAAETARVFGLFPRERPADMPPRRARGQAPAPAPAQGRGAGGAAPGRAGPAAAPEAGRRQAPRAGGEGEASGRRPRG